MMMADGYRMVGAANRDGLVAIENNDGKRLAAAVRGGIAWPWPVAVGTRLISAGAAVVVGFCPDDGRVRFLWCRLAGSVGPVYGADGWPEDGGIVGALREGAMVLGCWRWYAICGADDHAEALRVSRRYLKGLERLRVSVFSDNSALDTLRGILWRWAAERRLVDLPAKIVEEIEREEQESGPMPVTSAVAAVLESFERRPWRPAPPEEWKPVPREILAAQGG